MSLAGTLLCHSAELHHYIISVFQAQRLQHKHPLLQSQAHAKLQQTAFKKVSHPIQIQTNSEFLNRVLSKMMSTVSAMFVNPKHVTRVLRYNQTSSVQLILF